MKKYLLILILLIFILVPSTNAYAGIVSGFSADEFPTPPPMPEWAQGYYLTHNVHKKTNVDTWTVYYIEEPNNTYIEKSSNPDSFAYNLILHSPNKVEQYYIRSYYDSTLEAWFIQDSWYKPPSWDPLIVTSPNKYSLVFLQADGSQSARYWDFDIFTQNDNLWSESHPFPIPPLAGMVRLEMVPEVLGGVTNLIIPVGLVLLSVLLLVALIRYLFRSMTSKRT